LEYFLKEIDLNLKDKIALDIGSSTGGFVQILLENFVKEVVTVECWGNKSNCHKILRGG